MKSKTKSILVLSANTPWVYALAQSLAAHAPVTAVRMYDLANYRRLKPRWPESESAVRRVTITLPQGYAGTLEWMFRPLMRAILVYEHSHLRKLSSSSPFVVCPYPYLAPWVRSVPANRLIYYNLDEYPFYEPTRANRILRLERELIERAVLTVCLSVHQVRTLRERNPAHAFRIQHFPLGVMETFLNSSPDAPPIPNTIGYIGNLTNRVDWVLVRTVAEHMSETKFHFVGRLDEGPVGPVNGDWLHTRCRALALQNVVYEGAVPQAEVCEHYRRYAINWMPYDTTHGFNVACCPTKIMDALASGRPFLSTDIPEVRLYPDRIEIVRTADEAASILRSLLKGDYRHNPFEQVAFAAKQTWPHRALRFLDLIEDADLNARFADHSKEMTFTTMKQRQAQPI